MYNNIKKVELKLRMKNIIKILVILFLLLGIIFFCKRFIDSDYFKVQEVVVTGNTKLLKRDVTEQVEKMKGKNIVYLNTKEIEDFLRNDVRVKKVSITKQFPSKILFNIEERQPYAYVRKGENLFLADNELNIYGDKIEDLPKSMPIIDYTDEASFEGMKIIVSKIKNKDLYSMISEIRKTPKCYEILLVNGVVFKTDTDVTEEKYNDAYKAYDQIIRKEGPLTYIELRYKIIYKK